MSRALALAVALVVTLGACRTVDGAGARGDGGRDVVDLSLPAWLHAPAGVVRAPELEEAAALLCARDTDAVIDDDARHAAHVVDGQVFGVVKKAQSASDAQSALALDSAPLLTSKRATHAGVVVGSAPSGEACAALVGARRLIDVDGALSEKLPSLAPIAVSLRVPHDKSAALYLMKPDGFVEKRALEPCPGVDACDTKLTLPTPADGRYVIEVVVDIVGQASDPEVAMLWPLVVGKAKDPPFPEVLFPDEGHDDIALTHRAEALVQRLRNEELIEPFKVSPPLVDVATARAQGVAQRGTVGHRLPSATGNATDALQDLHARFGDAPRAQFFKLAEVQAQASTLADAWQALLDSPAHRYVLVDTSFTHCGVAVARGKDAAGRATVTMVALLARRPPQRDLDDVRATFLESANEARDKRGLAALTASSSLDRTALRLATAMRDAGRVDEELLGAPVAKVALESDAGLSHVKPLVARVDDPLQLLAKGIPPLLMDLDATHAGLGIALNASDGAFYVVVLAGE